ncbi:alpha/beta fold hydrolase [Massilia suwonensis]|uniref:Alpha/beta fold hydrolase n=1 Tax=Massilia suwonensis TaxID=648895 RepID=A0ABW0MJ50_9BURK
MTARTHTAPDAASGLAFAAIPSGIRIPYTDTGSGEALLFVHGSLCDYRYWSVQVAALSRHVRCISVSLSHYWPAGEAGLARPFGWQSHAAELAGFITALDLGPVHLVGHSRGGCVAFQLARACPQLVKTLTLADPGGPLHIDGQAEAALPPETIALRARVAELIEDGAFEAGLEMFVDSVSMPGIWRRSSPSFRTMALDNAATLPKQFRDPLPAYTRADAAGVQCPTLLIEGERSPRMYRDNVEWLAQWITRAERQTIAGASHGMNMTHPGSFNRLVRGFVAAGA